MNHDALGNDAFWGRRSAWETTRLASSFGDSRKALSNVSCANLSVWNLWLIGDNTASPSVHNNPDIFIWFFIWLLM